MAKKQIVMSQREYDSQREILKEEITLELQVKYKYIPRYAPIFIIIMFGYLMPNLWSGYEYTPIMTTITSVLGGFMYSFLIYMYILMFKKRRFK